MVECLSVMRKALDSILRPTYIGHSDAHLPLQHLERLKDQAFKAMLSCRESWRSNKIVRVMGLERGGAKREG